MALVMGSATTTHPLSITRYTPGPSVREGRFAVESSRGRKNGVKREGALLENVGRGASDVSVLTVFVICESKSGLDDGDFFFPSIWG